ncbi:MAG: tyrosine--tRNA ligase [Pseudomonadales bacterium]|nr:tyrosine--tRNA ligase [Pseudomonadales bacterium]
MSVKNNDLLDDLDARGLVSQMTGGGQLAEHLAKPRNVYCGFDPTSDSLHIGSLVPLLALKRFQMAGHKPIALVGGATGLIGDPSGKAQERQLNTSGIVSEWAECLKKQVSRFIDFDCGSNSAEVVNNYDWIGSLDLVGFLRDVGKHFSVNMMIQKESVKQRIEREGEGISYTEFTYMILQSYDFAELYKRNDCSVQIGGSDQWGNITGGIDLGRRMYQAELHGLTLPLITKADGTKFGKSETGTIWLDPDKTSPYSFYQFWMNTGDADVYRFLRYFTFMSVEGIDTLEASDAEVSGRKQAQGVLAGQVTELVHGKEGLDAAKRISEALFDEDLGRLSQDEIGQLALDGLPITEIVGKEKLLIEVLVESGLALTPRGEVTMGQARKFIKGNAVSVNGEKIVDVGAILSSSEGMHQKYHLIRRGKKHFHLLVWR